MADEKIRVLDLVQAAIPRWKVGAGLSRGGLSPASAQQGECSRSYSSATILHAAANINEKNPNTLTSPG